MTTHFAAVPTANDRLKQSFQGLLALSFVSATLLHVLVFELWPEMRTERWAQAWSDPVDVLRLKDIEIPPPPIEVRSPAAPVASVNVSAEETIPVVGFKEYASLLAPPVADEDGGGLVGGTAFSPFTVAPTLENPLEVQRALERAYPTSLRDAGLGGTVTLRVHIDAAGRVMEAGLGESSGYEALDEAAIDLIDILRFRPAMNRDKRVAVWIQIPLTFRVR